MAEDTKTETAEQREVRWWTEWRAEDYSWAGLARKRWRGWVVVDEDFVVEAKSGRRYGAAADTDPDAVPHGPGDDGDRRVFQGRGLQFRVRREADFIQGYKIQQSCALQRFRGK